MRVDGELMGGICEVKNRPSAAKAGLIFKGVMYGLKPVPFKLSSFGSN
jgi:hypothetical protein